MRRHMADLGAIQRDLLTFLGLSLSRHPQSFMVFLQEEGLFNQSKLDTDEMANVLVKAILHQDPNFHHRLAIFLKSLIRPVTYDDFTGADPLSAVAGAVSSISNVFGQAQKNKQYEKQARQATLDGVLAYRQYQQQLISQRQKQQHDERRLSSIIRLSALVGGIGLIGLLIWLLLKPSRNSFNMKTS